LCGEFCNPPLPQLKPKEAFIFENIIAYVLIITQRETKDKFKNERSIPTKGMQLTPMLNSKHQGALHRNTDTSAPLNNVQNFRHRDIISSFSVLISGK